MRDALGATSDGMLWAMHLNAFRALAAAATQWRTRIAFTDRGIVERVVGLDYGALKVALDVLGLVLSAEDWRQLMVLEREAVRALNGEPG